MYRVVLFLFFMPSKCILSDDQFTIGGIFYSDAEDMKAAFTVSGRIYNFSTSIKEVSNRGEILEIRSLVCELAEEGVIGVIDGTGGRASEHIQALCDVLELPHILIQHNDIYSKNWSMINLYPSSEAFNMVLENLIPIKDWNNFTILYSKGYSITRVESLFTLGNYTDRYTIALRELSGDDYRDVLINAKENGYTNFVVDCPSKHLEQLLRHAQQVGLMAEEHSYLFVSPDLFTLDLTRYRYGGVNMTGFRLLDLKQNKQLFDFTEQYNAELVETVLPEQIKTRLVLIHDAVLIFSLAIRKVNITAVELNCVKYEPWIYGSSLMNFMRTNKAEGISRSLIFDGLGQRNDVIFDILELTPAGNQTIGFWKQKTLSISRPFVPTAEIGEESIMRNKTFKVLIAMVPPYGYVTKSEVELEGNDRYEGFTVDLIARLGEMLGFNYEFEVENTYGNLDRTTGKWTGMILKLREEKADFALCDFTITAERQTGIDFSTPFMTLGISILYKEPSKQPPEMFSFMAVFSNEVWYNMMLTQLGLGIVMIFVGRISHKEWQNPVPCIEQPEILSNQFSFANSVWLIIGSVMQQGSEIAPIAIAPRMITSVWWFFTMVMVASYTGTLVAFLTVEKNVLPFETLKQLYDLKSTPFGAKRVGSTIQFFKDSNKSLHRGVYEKMVRNNWLFPNNDVAVDMAENASFAVFMESTSIEYYKERHCDLIQVGKLLDAKSYGIGMKQGSKYKRYIDDALLKLKERGEIQKLKDIWWKEKRGGGKCGETRNEEPKQLGMKNMLGAFVVLGFGCLIGLLISTLDMLWGVFKRTVKYGTTYKYELIEELKFALSFSGDIKPVKRPRTGSKSSSSEALANEVKNESPKEEVLSVRSVLSGRSTDTRRTHHSHSSRHSPHDLSTTFARMRENS